MSQIIGYSTEDALVSGAIRDHSLGEPERFSGFTLPRSEISATITEEKLAAALGITLSKPE